MLIIQPLSIGLVIGYKYVNSIKEKKEKSHIRNCLLIVALTIIFSYGIGEMVLKASYGKEEWKNFKKLDAVRIYLIDYQNMIAYSELEDILVKYDIDENEYEQFLQYHYWFLDVRFTTDCVDELLPRLKEIRKENLVSQYIGIAIWQLVFGSKEFWHLHQIVFLGFVLTAILLVIRKEWWYLTALGGGFLGYVVGITALAYRNRFVLRVMFPYYSGALLLMSVFIYLIWISEPERNKEYNWFKNWSIPVGFLIILGLELYTGRIQFSYIRRQNHLVNKQNYEIMKEITKYCNDSPEKHFVLDLSYARNCSTDILENQYYKQANYIYSGSWYSLAPPMLEKSEEYIETEALFYLVYEAQEWKGKEGLEYYESKTGMETEVIDTFKLSNGATMWVYKIERG